MLRNVVVQFEGIEKEKIVTIEITNMIRRFLCTSIRLTSPHANVWKHVMFYDHMMNVVIMLLGACCIMFLLQG